MAPRLEAEAKRRWKAAGTGGETTMGDSLEAHRLDAFIDLMSGGSAVARRGRKGEGDDDQGDEERTTGARVGRAAVPAEGAAAPARPRSPSTRRAR